MPRLCFDKFGLRLLLRDRQAIFPEALDMQVGPSSNVLVQRAESRGDGDAARQVGNLGGIALCFLNHQNLFHLPSTFYPACFLMLPNLPCDAHGLISVKWVRS